MNSNQNLVARAINQLRMSANNLSAAVCSDGPETPAREEARKASRLINQLANALAFGPAYLVAALAKDFEEGNTMSVLDNIK